jgi:hypothetical protein
MMLDEIAAEIRDAGHPIAMIAGSGVSYSAGIPTGQEVLREIARMRGESADPDPVAWYLRSLGAFPNYFGMVGDENDALPGEIFASGRAPTPAHRAIARLAAAGVVGPILTPNLDRLLEQALTDASVAFDVAFDLDGLARMTFERVAVCKLHGDYQDIRVRHTALGEHIYHGAIDRLLDSVFTGFDLLVCGWSASWDVPLCRALCRASGRRTWWLHRGPLSEAAQEVFAIRHPRAVQVSSSDEGMTRLSRLLLDTDRCA